MNVLYIDPDRLQNSACGQNHARQKNHVMLGERNLIKISELFDFPPKFQPKNRRTEETRSGSKEGAGE